MIGQNLRPPESLAQLPFTLTCVNLAFAPLDIKERQDRRGDTDDLVADLSTWDTTTRSRENHKTESSALLSGVQTFMEASVDRKQARDSRSGGPHLHNAQTGSS